MVKIDKGFLLKLVLIGILSFFIFNFEIASSLFRTLLLAFRPIIIGLILALVLNLPLNFFEKKVFAKLKREKTKKHLALLCTILIIVIFFAGIIYLVIPQIIASSKGIGTSVKQFVEKNFNKSNQVLTWIVNNLQEYMGDITQNFGKLMPNIMDYTSKFVKGIVDVFLGLFLAILILATKDNLLEQLDKVLYYKLERSKVARLISALNLAVKKFSRYLGGQVVEAIIFGIAMYIGLAILRIPYAPLIAVIMGFVNLIPMVGGYIGAIVSTILIFAIDPTKAIVFLIFSTILQQLEAVTTYPIIVGKNVGLNAFWILASVIIGGALFGFVGIFLGVPAMAFVHDYIGQLIKLDKEETEKERREQKLKEGADKQLLELIEENKQIAEKKKIVTDEELS